MCEQKKNEIRKRANERRRERRQKEKQNKAMTEEEIREHNKWLDDVLVRELDKR